MTALAQRIPLQAERPAPWPTGEQRLVLQDVSWEAYEMIGEALRDRPAIRMTYDQGKLEIMTISPKHGRLQKRLGRIVEALAEEHGLARLALETAANMTFKRGQEQGLEGDDCFWIAHEAEIRGRQDWDPYRDPPPDLLLEIELSQRLVDRLGICAALGIPEIWCCDGQVLRVLLLQPDKTYRQSAESPTFPGIPRAGIAGFLRPSAAMDYLGMVRAFRAWVREQRKQGTKPVPKQQRSRKKRGKN